MSIETEAPLADDDQNGARRNRRVPFFIGGAGVAVLTVLALMVWRADSRTNKVALDKSAKLVSVVDVRAAHYQPSRTYVGTLQARAEASVGPQLISAYVDTVLVRPGAIVTKGQVLATLDCQTASSASQAIAMKARAISARQVALEDEATRYQQLLDGGFVARNQAEQELAKSDAEQANLLAEQAQLAQTTLGVNDCVLRAPFDGEIATRFVDPGAFVHPGTSVVLVVDRRRVIVMVDAPEKDFEVVAPGTGVGLHVIATNKDLHAIIARRSPKADVETRTVHFEIDLPDPQRQLPVGTTARLRINVGTPVDASEIPLYAGSVSDEKVSVFVVRDDVAHEQAVRLKGEAGGQLYLDTSLGAGSKVVTQGRELLSDGDRVTATPEMASTPNAKDGTP